ncbi:MAG: PRC-barrel domain-containing protein [Halomonas subglaciescola]|nr:PRC-barrel domain-containing protein [Halomonas subglaciescola]
MRKTILMTALGASLLSVTLGAQAQTEPQGMYTAENILDADVYIMNGSGDPIGEVEDILFDEQMKVSGLVVESGKVLGLGGRELVVGTDYFSLETNAEGDDDFDDVEHRVMIDATAEEVEQFPAYNHDWWEQAQSNAQDAWQTTQKGAESAWQKTRDAASDMTDN